MSDILFSLNITVPVFLLMVIGMVFRKIGWISENFAKEMNKFVFKVALPISVFKSLATVSFKESMDFKFVGFCMLVTVCTIIIAMVIAHIAIRKEVRGEFIQACFRSNTALLGMALITSVYPDSIYGPLMLLGCIPIYNITSVVILTIYSPENIGFQKGTVKKVLFGIAKNPIIIGIACGLIWAFFSLPYPDILSKTVSYMSNLATPMGLMALGATFEIRDAMVDLKASILASFMKLFGFVIIFLPIAYIVGFKSDAMLSLTLMLGSSLAVGSYSMSINMGHKAILTSTVLMITTLLCGFSLTLWIYILKFLSII